MFGMTKTACPARQWIPATFRHWCVGRYYERSFDWALPCPTLLTGHTYLLFLQEVLGELLEDVSLDIHRRLWFQNDGAPPHFGGMVCHHLNRCFGQGWIGRGGPIAWHPRSPDLTPLDFCVGPHKVSGVSDPCGLLEHLLAGVMGAAQEIQHTPGVMERVYQNMIRRYNVCNELGGRHIEALL